MRGGRVEGKGPEENQDGLTECRGFAAVTDGLPEPYGRGGVLYPCLLDGSRGRVRV